MVKNVVKKDKDSKYTYIQKPIPFFIANNNPIFLMDYLRGEGLSCSIENGRIGNLQLKTDHTSNEGAINYLKGLLDNKQLKPKCLFSQVYLVMEGVNKIDFTGDLIPNI